MVDDYAGYKASFAQGVSELACCGKGDGGD